MNFIRKTTEGPFYELTMILLFLTTSFLLFMLVGIVLSSWVYGVDLSALGGGFSAEKTYLIPAFKLLQIIMSLGLFVFPAFVVSRFLYGSSLEYLQLKKSSSFHLFLLTMLLMLATLPLVDWLAVVNSKMVFPEFLSGVENWMREKEEDAEVLTTAFLAVSSWSGLLVNLFMMALIPALGEELVFRGLIQQLFARWMRKPHAAIWITAFIFSAFHMQFYGFIPRFLLGALLGYLFYWSQNLWVPILAHFTNNATVVILEYSNRSELLTSDKSEQNIFFLVISFLAVTGITYWLFHNFSQLKNKAL